jgi:signal peptidase I
MFRIIKVTGDSLSPFYIHGDYVITTTWYGLFGHIHPGDTVVFVDPDYGMMIKKVTTVKKESQKLFVLGNQPRSVDSRQLGPIPFESVIGKVIWQIKKPDRPPQNES